MGTNRDDFTKGTKELLAKRVGYRCSNPHCGKQTIGAAQKEDEVINVGVAAHIKAAAPGGPRYDPDMTEEERKSPKNGIWLCQTCSKLIDSDVDKYTVQLLRNWKKRAEEQTEVDLQGGEVKNPHKEDVEILKFYLQCMDRPAFQDSLNVHLRRHDHQLVKFRKALRDTVVAFNTGVLRDRDGALICQSAGKTQIHNDQWRKQLGAITRILTDMGHAIDARWNEDGSIMADRGFVDGLERKRREALKILNALCAEAGLPGLECW